MFSRVVFVLLAFVPLALAQDSESPHSHNGMGQMNAAILYQMNLASGTSANPASLIPPMRMLHFDIGTEKWNAMLMGTGFAVDTQQSRGGDKLYSSNWLMGSLQHKVGAKGSFQADLMLSLEPATVTNRSYPLLFQTGETAFGNPLSDAQHPHNFVMALGFHYTRQLAARTFLDLYVAPVGDPALGPVAFPHRASASEIPQAPISHHLQDSTHIANDVVTLGFSRKQFKLEASGFHGQEPGENRWVIQQGAIDSWSARLWYFPSSSWAAQVSAGHIAHPEALEAADQVRVTSSVSYAKNGWASSVIWGRTHNTITRRDLNAYLFESVLNVHRNHFVTGRMEWADKDELGNVPSGTYRIGAYTIGYTRELHRFRYLTTALGANFSAYTVPDAIKPFYGAHPVGGNVFVRVRVR